MKLSNPEDPMNPPKGPKKLPLDIREITSPTTFVKNNNSLKPLTFHLELINFTLR